MFDIVKELSGIILGLTLAFFSLFPQTTSIVKENEKPIDVKPNNSASTTAEITTHKPEFVNENKPPVNKKNVSATTTTLAKKIPPPAPKQVPQTATNTDSELANNTDDGPDQATFSKTNESVRKTVVNILCTSKQGGLFQPISGSGVIIDSRGVILTNAHIGQYFLLKNHLSSGFIECIIRTGSPAYPQYRASLLYISPNWVKTNGQKILEQEPTGTGEYDYALLLATSTIAGDPIPALPHITIQLPFNGLEKNSPVILASYPAGFLGGASIQQNLYETSTIGSISDLFTFTEKTPDTFSIHGSIVAQHGSSGGAVTNQKGSLVGIITTADTVPATGDRYLGAITIDYINRSLKEETGLDLASFLSGNLNERFEDFSTRLLPSLIINMESQIINRH